MPKAIEDCVRKIKGTNKRTGKPYTQSEKWAICTAMHKKNKNASFEEDEILADEEIAAKVENSMAVCMKKMMDRGKTSEDARHACEAMLARSNYNVEMLEFIFTKDLL